jgi:DNA polymerase-3 subunit beta
MISTINIECESKDNLSVCIPAKILIDILKTFPEQPVVFNVGKNNTVKITSSTGEYEIAFHSSETYPKLPEINPQSAITVPAEVLYKGIVNTIFATGNDDFRPVMLGVFLQFSPEGLTFVATDAHKLSKYSRKDITSNEAAGFIVPKKPLNVLKAALSGSKADLVIEYNDTHITFKFENRTISCRLIDGKYPNYEAVIPKRNPNKLFVERNQFLSSVKRVSIFSNKTSHMIRLKMAGTELNISAEDIDYSNKGDESITCNYQGEDMQIGFNSKFLIEMLSNLDSDEIQLEMSLPNRAGVLKPVDGIEDSEELLMLVMPVMLSD